MHSCWNIILILALIVTALTQETCSVDDGWHLQRIDFCGHNDQPKSMILNFNGYTFMLHKSTEALHIYHNLATESQEESSAKFSLLRGAHPIIEANWTKEITEAIQNIHCQIKFKSSHHPWKFNIGISNGKLASVVFSSISQSDLGSITMKSHQYSEATEIKTEITGSISLQSKQPIMTLFYNHSSGNFGWNLQLKLESPFFNWLIYGNGTLQHDSGSRELTVQVDANLLDRPTKPPLHYQLRYSENRQSPYVDLRHKISSEIFSFEGNMTVFQGPENGSIITEIFQRTASQLWPFLNSDLHQIFHQLPDFSWETVVMRSGLMDMHVTGKWATSIWEYYQKRFQFRSHWQLLPSVNVRLDYSNKRHFFHEFHFLLMAKKLQVLVEFSDADIIFPVKISASFQDEFRSNVSDKIMEIVVSKTDYFFRVDFNARDQFWEVVKQVTQHFSQVWSVWKEISFDDKHPLNQLLSPILNLEGSNFGLWVQKLNGFIGQTVGNDLDDLVTLFFS